MRYIICFIALLATPAAAWEFVPEPVCTLRHATPQADIEITYDASIPLYTLRVRRNGAVWKDSTTFGMRFEGGAAIAIGTTRHRIDGGTLTVEDSGFGNVLDGLEFNRSVRTLTESQSLEFDLTDAAGPVQQFRRCPEGIPATS